MSGAEPGPAPDSEAVADTTLHASTVVFPQGAVLIRGPAGAGKSALALALIALGARLVADDRTRLRRDGARVMARAPEAIAGLIEARGVGLLRASPAGEAALALLVDLGRRETERLPPPRRADVLGVALPLLHDAGSPYFPAAIRQYLAGGGRADRQV